MLFKNRFKRYTLKVSGSEITPAEIRRWVSNLLDALPKILDQDCNNVRDAVAAAELCSHSYKTYLGDYEYDTRKLKKQRELSAALGHVVDMLDGVGPRPRWFPATWLKDSGITPGASHSDVDPHAEVLALIYENSDEIQLPSRLSALGLDTMIVLNLMQLTVRRLSGSELRHAITAILRATGSHRHAVAAMPGVPRIRLVPFQPSTTVTDRTTDEFGVLNWSIDLDQPSQQPEMQETANSVGA